jgi:amino acid permease
MAQYNNRYNDADDLTVNNIEPEKFGGEKDGYIAGGDNRMGGQAAPAYRVPSNVVETQQAKPKKPMMTRIMHSFRRKDDNVTLNALGQQVRKDDPEKPYNAQEDGGEISHDTSRLNRKLKGRHMQMIAIGGAIGTGLFIGSGSALATGGPAALVIGWGIIGIMLFCVIHALGELAVMFPIAGKI